MKTKPYNRHETFLAALSDSSITVPTPLSREELYLAKIAGETVTIPAAPYNRYETYLAKIAGEDVIVPTPVSRLEYYLYKACGNDCNVPIPASREEIFWKRYVGEECNGDTVKITDAVSAPMKSLIIKITPVQGGSGVPSPENVRPIEGWSAVDVRDTDANMWGGSSLLHDVMSAVPNATVDYEENTISYSASMSTSHAFIGNTRASILPSAYRFEPGKRYTFIVCAKTSYGTQINATLLYTEGALYPTGFVKDEKKAVAFSNPKGKDVLGLVKTAYSGTTTIYANECGLYEGIIALTDNTPYNGNAYSIDISSAGKVYGGTLDVVSGLLTVTHAYIESYNNEDIPGEWISSEDVYIIGTKPTVGAQVVYKMDKDDWEMYQLQPVEVVALEGLNKIWSVCGPVNVTYIPDL